jgi:hypothetical protein
MTDNEHSTGSDRRRTRSGAGGTHVVGEGPVAAAATASGASVVDDDLSWTEPPPEPTPFDGDRREDSGT